MKTFVDTGGSISVVVEVDQYHDIGLLHTDNVMWGNRKEFVTIQPSPEMTTNFRIQRIGPVTLNSFHPLNSLLSPVQREPDLSGYKNFMNA